MFLRSGKIVYIHFVPAAKALAIREALILCLKAGFLKVELECDCAIVIPSRGANLVVLFLIGILDPYLQTLPVFVVWFKSLLVLLGDRLMPLRTFITRYVARVGWLGSGFSRAAIFNTMFNGAVY